MQGTAPPTKQQWGLQMASSMSWKNVQQNVQSVQFKKSGEAPIGWIRSPVDSKDGFKKFNPHASEFNPLGFSSGMYSFRQSVLRFSLDDDKHTHTTTIKQASTETTLDRKLENSPQLKRRNLMSFL